MVQGLDDYVADSIVTLVGLHSQLKEIIYNSAN